jgi:4-alpha-glucanotransferase
MLTILPLQDVLGLDSRARMNTPGNPSSNWTWRLSESPSPELARRLLEATRRSGRTDA